MRNTLIPILVAICLFITGVAILNIQLWYSAKAEGNDSNLLIVFYVQIMPDDFVMQFHRF